MNELKKIQQKPGDGELWTDWKKAVAAGKIRGDNLQRDKDSSLFGSAGLIPQRLDENLPYIDRPYVKQEDKKPASPPDFFENLKKNFFDKEK